MKRALLAALLALFTSLALAQATPGNQRKGAAAPPSAEEQAIRARLQQTFNISPSSITRTPFGWYEVVVNTDVIYVDPTANYLFANGSVIDTRTRENLTQARKDDLMKVDYAKLPLDQAVRIRFGNGSRQFVTFEDPNCGFCKKLHADLYEQGERLCSAYGPAEVAKSFNLPTTDPEQLAKLYAEKYEAATPSLVLPVQQGCLAGFRQWAKKNG